MRVSSKSRLFVVKYGEDGVEQGDVLYLDSAEQKYKLAKCSGTSLEAYATHWALTAGDTDDSGAVAEITKDVEFDPGAAVVKAETYILSENAGKIAPITDFAGYAAGRFKTVLGSAKDTTTIEGAPDQTGVAKT